MLNPKPVFLLQKENRFYATFIQNENFEEKTKRNNTRLSLGLSNRKMYVSKGTFQKVLMIGFGSSFRIPQSVKYQ